MISKLLKKIEKGTADKRCMTCKHWKPVTENTGKCMLSKTKMFTLPNYVCQRWEKWNE